MLNYYHLNPRMNKMINNNNNNNNIVMKRRLNKLISKLQEEKNVK